MQARNENANPSPLSVQQQQEVLAALTALMESPLFSQSKRYPAFLQYVVECTLRGDDAELKERTIGIEVFGRQPQYDTSLDPTVRLTAAEVRKRLAQYYQQPDHAEGVRIELHPGSYVPTFVWPDAEPGVVLAPVLETASELPAILPAEPSVSPQAIRAVPETGLRWLPWGGGVAIVLLVATVIGYRHMSGAQPTSDVLTPLLRDPNPVAIVLPDISKAQLVAPSEENDDTTVMSHIRYSRLVDFNDSVALAQLTGMLGRQSKLYNVLLSSDATFEDLQRGPVILIGAVDNPWTLRFLQPLPYNVLRRGETLTFDIVGRDHSTQHGWSLDLTQSFEKLQQDYGIIVRQTDSMTGRPVLIVAGLGQNGTAAGIRLLSDPALEGEITAQAPKGWSGKNVEVVFKTQIIADKFGPPVIVAREYW